MIDPLQFQAFTKASAEEFAPGIPKARKTHPLPKVKEPQNWTLAVQRHNADRAGEHLDLRLVDPSSGHAHSWAIPKARLPGPGDKPVLAIPQPTHTADYALTAGLKGNYTIPHGYGAGTVKMDRIEPAEVYHADPRHPVSVRFNTYSGRGPEEFALVRTTGGSQLLVNKTRTKAGLPHLELGSKPQMKVKDPKHVDFEDNNEVMMPKYDGAHGLLDLDKAGRIPRAYSYRSAKKATAGIIEHTHKIPYLLKQRVPSSLAGTVLRTELLGINNETGRPLPAREIAGMLNAAVPRSRENQKARNAVLMPMGLDVERFKGKDVRGLPFSQRYEMLKQVRDQMGIPITDVAYTAAEKRDLLSSVKQGKHPMTTEGVVLRQRHQVPDAVTKVKFRPDHDIYVRGIFQAVGKDGSPLDRAGGFSYSHTPAGKVVGRVGTGFNHATLRDMLQDPKKYIGRVAKVEAEQVYNSGALGKASFQEWHLDKGKQI